MSEWTPTKLPIAVPGDYRGLGNKAAALFDPNTAGELTFPEPNAVMMNPPPEWFGDETDPMYDLYGEPTHCLIRSQLVTDFVPMLSLPYRTADVWEPVLAQMAQERGKEMLTRAKIELLCAELLFDSECDNLTRIEYD